MDPILACIQEHFEAALFNVMVPKIAFLFVCALNLSKENYAHCFSIQALPQAHSQVPSRTQQKQPRHDTVCRVPTK